MTLRLALVEIGLALLAVGVFSYFLVSAALAIGLALAGIFITMFGLMPRPSDEGV